LYLSVDVIAWLEPEERLAFFRVQQSHGSVEVIPKFEFFK